MPGRSPSKRRPITTRPHARWPTRWRASATRSCAIRNFPALFVADNPAGSSPAARTDWCFSVRRFHVGTGHPEPTYDAGYTTAGYFPLTTKPISFLLCLEGSPYMLD